MNNNIKSQFIINDNLVPDKISLLAENAIRFGRVADTGRVIIDVLDLSPDEKIKLSLILRFIGGSLDPEKISKSVSPKELIEIVSERNEAVGSRLSKLAKMGFCKAEGHGKYTVYSYKIESFLNSLADRESFRSSGDYLERRTKIRSAQRKIKTLTGVGLHIQELIDSSFFKEPKLLGEIERELVREGKFHDVRVIDSALKNVFLLGRRGLKRLPNKDGGRSKWKYVNR